MHINCKNCGAHFRGHYCPNCAQKATTARLKVSNVLHEFWHNFTHTDKGYVSLLTALVKQPGVVIKEYIDERRKKYFNPYTFYLVNTALLILIGKQVFHYEDKLFDYRNEYGQYINEHYNLIVLFSMPFIAFMLQAIFLKYKYNYAEWVTFLIFTFGLINFFQIFIQLLYFPLIKFHYQVKSYTDFIGYFIMLMVLIRFIKPIKAIQWLQCIAATLLIYFFVELIAQLFALWIYGVPVEKLIQMFKNQF
jgi:hypothetical protein